MHQIIDKVKVLFDSDQIQAKCEELGEQLSKDYKDKNVLLVGLLKGCIPFMSDLMRHITIPIRVDFMDVSSYHGGTFSSGQVKINKDLDTNIEGVDVLIAEDIVDTGQTLDVVIRMLKLRKPNSIRIVTLLDKPEGRVVDLKPDYVGFTISKMFVLGYGLDYDEYYRNLPYIGVVNTEEVSKKEV